VAERPTAVVTGASRGIGRAVARRLAAQYRVIAIARDEKELRRLSEEIASAGGDCHPLTVDLAQPAAIDTAMRDLEADVLVNNAGVITKKPLVDLTSRVAR
jgi:short-subunit dehydrogenase